MLYDILGSAQAYRALYDPRIGGRMNAEELYNLCLQAGYSEEASQDAARERALERLRKDLPA